MYGEIKSRKSGRFMNTDEIKKSSFLKCLRLYAVWQIFYGYNIPKHRIMLDVYFDIIVFNISNNTLVVLL